MLLPGSRAAFAGKVFDGDNQLALMGKRRYVTFSLPVGLHVLSSNWWMTTGPAGGSHITINLLADHHYYISTSFEEMGLGGTRMVVKEVSCEEAQQANSNTKPLEQKHLKQLGIATVVAETTFPQCMKPD
jgi:hypothetical protein